MPCPFFMHVDGGRWKGAGDVADTARMVEVDVRDGDAGQLRRTDSDLAQRSEKNRH